MKKIKVLVDWCDTNYAAVASGDELDGAILVTDRSLERLKEKFKETLEFHIEGIIAGGDPVPPILQGKYELEFELSTQALLKSLKGKTSSTASVINVQLLSNYATGVKRPRSVQRVVNGENPTELNKNKPPMRAKPIGGVLTYQDSNLDRQNQNL